MPKRSRGLAAILLLLAATAPARAQDDRRARDDAAPLITAGLLDRRTDVPPDLFASYRRDVHGPLAARINGFHQYWQHHLGAPRADFWPLAGVEQTVPNPYQIEGFAETTFRSEADRARLGEDPAARQLFFDEQNVFQATCLCPSKAGDSRTYLDRFADGTPQGPRQVPTYIVFLHRVEGATPEALNGFLRERFAPALAASHDLAKVRLHLLQPFDPAAWNTPGVRHDLPPQAQYHAILEVAFADAGAERRFLGSAGLTQMAGELPHLVAALHTYPVVATYTMVYDGRPTLVGLKGLSVAETIQAIGAANQTLPDVLRLLNGSDAETPSALRLRGRGDREASR